jgi:hypothetical protein
MISSARCLQESDGGSAVRLEKCEIASDVSSTLEYTTKKQKYLRKKSDQYDVFLSYRVAADAKLVEELWWRLSGFDVVVDGKTRKLRVFWDRKCLLPGESWEACFSRALCSSTLVVTILSRNALSSVEELTPDSPCDNVLLEFELALALADIKGISLFPLFVGDKVKNDDEDLERQIKDIENQLTSTASNQDPGRQEKKAQLSELKKKFAGLDERYTHYFKSKCHPQCPSIIVRSIEEKCKIYVNEVLDALSLELIDIKPRTVQEVMDGVLKYQGHFLTGQESEAVDGAMVAIHKCAERIMLELSNKKLVETLQFSTPQGQEVLEWLAENMLSHYIPVFARNKLDSLWKVSKLSDPQVSELNNEFSEDFLYSKSQIGGHIRLEEAVSSLQHDIRAKSIKDQLLNYVDSSATNKVQEARREWAFFLSGALLVGLIALFGIPFGTGLPLYGTVLLETQEHSVTSYMVQRSVDGVNWTDIMCNQQQCVFENTVAVAKTGQVVTNRLPHMIEARYIRILPRNWLHMDDGSAGGDLRVGIMGSPEDGPCLVFNVLQDGHAKQAWLQNGCNKNTSAAGMWASKDEIIGKVQCCLNSPGVHVCTRDGCLTGRNGDALSINWYEAKSKCESRGWRLCSREELNRKASSGCCGSDMAGTNLCGYDDKLVWTGTTGDTDLLETKGRLYSETAIQNSKQVTLDLLRVRWVDGLNVQSAVPEIQFHGIACFYWMWFISVQYGIQTIFILLKLRLGLTSYRGSAAHNFGMYGSFALFFLFGIIGILADTCVPSVSSGNPVCKTHGPQISAVFVSACIYFAAVCFKFGVDFFCPDLAKYLLPTAAYLSHGSACLLYTAHNAIGWDSGWVELFRYVGIILIAWPLIHNASKFWATKTIHHQARSKMLGDIEKYVAVWESAGGIQQVAEKQEDRHRGVHPLQQARLQQPHNLESNDCNGHLESIQKRCSWATAKIKEELDDAVTKFPVVDRLLFKMRAGPRSWQHESRYARTGKYRQRTQDIDLLFDEATMLNDRFLDLVDGLVSRETGWKGLVRGPVKRPDRALQKVVRRYNRDARCLTDLVRCCILLPSICDVGRCLEVLLGKSVVGLHEEEGEQGPATGKFFKVVKVKDRFTTDQKDGYRDICLNVEVAWTILSESEKELEFLPVYDKTGRSWDSMPRIRTHICEIQLLLEGMYTLKASGCHENFVMARNLLTL